MYANLQTYAKHKLEPRSHRCIFLGYPSSVKSYRCYSSQQQWFYIVADAIFDETVFPFVAPVTDVSSNVSPPASLELPLYVPPLTHLQPDDSHMQEPRTDASHMSTPVHGNPTTSRSISLRLQPEVSSPATEAITQTTIQKATNPPPQTAPLAHPMVTRLQDGTVPRQHMQKDHTYALTTSVAVPSTPSCYSQIRQRVYVELMRASKLLLGPKSTYLEQSSVPSLTSNHPFIQQGTSPHEEIEAGINPLYFQAYPMTLPSRVSLGCHKWNISLGIAEEWVYEIKRDRDGKISWHAFDPIYQLWQPLPPVPKEYSEALGFGCAVLSGCHLYLFGGKNPLKGSIRRVVFYSARTYKRHRAPDMLRRRHFFGSCVITSCLYVAGGENEGVHSTMRSAEVYDPNRNRWSFISEMSTAMVPFIGVVDEGKWYLKGLSSHRQVHSEVYQPETDSWFPVYDGMVAGWRNPSVSFNGHLYALDRKNGCKLRVYDEVTDSWSKHIDSKMHLGNSQALEAAALVPLNGKLCVIRNNMSISVVDVSKSDGGRGATAEHLWETIAGKSQLRTMVTNLWSNLGGRNRLKSHIVHCQVLQA
ncbi:hypothetical protein NL676_035579 [Syzygium grande]|nr:hypothetical protein NL676_035579 [Syzygium grande]